MTRKARTSRATRVTRAEEPIRAVAYVRLSRHKAGESTSDRRNTDVGLDTQRAGCERAIAALGGAIVGVEQDVQSGDRLDRPGLWRAIDRIAAGEANALIVYALDRFGRDQNQQGVAAIEIKRAGGRLLSATENLEDGPMGDFMRSVYGLAAALELAKIRERVNRGLDARFRQSARYKPSSRPIYGYQKIGVKAETTYTVEPAEAVIVERIYRERASGASVRRIMDGLNADGVPTPTGRGKWGTATVSAILGRSVYTSGEHECWRTQTARDADNVPFVEDRPVEERYTVAFPAIIAPALLNRVRVVAERNVWSSRRDDRPAECGIGRFGFFRCATCGRALSVIGRADGRQAYHCTSKRHATRPCPSPASIAVPLLDGPVWWWIQSLIEDSSRADAWRVVEQPHPVDALAVDALAAAERALADLEAQAGTLLDNLGLLTGEAARLAAQRLNDMHSRLSETRAARDALADAAAAVAAIDLPPVTRLEAGDALAAVTLDAIAAMRAADPNPAQTHSVTVLTLTGHQQMVLPDSWKARRAAMSVLGVHVTLARESAAGPRWVAEMRLPGGMVIQGQEDRGYWFRTKGPDDAYLFGSHR